MTWLLIAFDGKETALNKRAITKLVNTHPPKTALDQAFYTDVDIYTRDIEEIYLKSWLYAGHVSEIPAIGDWFLFELAGESVIIVRSDTHEINALVNVCRHRGSRICLTARGCARKLICGYHGWTYELDGRLRNAAHMQKTFDKSGIALKKIHVEVLEGMIYVNFGARPASFEVIRNGLTECLRSYRLDTAKVAHRQTYSIDANWKLAVENYSECYHCAPAHPEYTRGHSLAKPGAHSEALMEEVMQRASACGLSDKSVSRIYLDAEGFGADYAYERYPMWQGHITGSEDGQAVAPLLGDVSDYDGGTTDIQIGPVNFALAYCDHVVIYRFTPVSLDRSECDITWLVNGSAEEGKDYDKERLAWLWDVTTTADKRIIESNAKGIKSRYYKPGPLAHMEDYTWKFISWYLRAIKP